MSAFPRFPTPRLTAIGSGKGGTGKTIISIALAQMLADRGERVLLCDADLGLANASVHLGSNYGGDLAGVLRGKRKLANAVVTVRREAQPRSFDLLAAAPGSGALAAATPEEAMCLAAALQSANQYERVLMDLSAGIGPITMMLAAAADETAVVLTPDAASLTGAYAFTKLLMRRTGSRAPEFLVNMAPTEAEARRASDAFRTTCRAFLSIEPNCLGYVPQDARLAGWVRRQEMLASRAPDSAAMCAFEEVASALAARRPSGVGAVAGLR